MKITNYTRQNGLKIYTLEHNKKVIAQSNNINLIIQKKESILYASYNKRENYNNN